MTFATKRGKRVLPAADIDAYLPLKKEGEHNNTKTVKEYRPGV